MLDRPWVRLLLGVLAAAALGALAARVALSVPTGTGGVGSTGVGAAGRSASASSGSTSGSGTFRASGGASGSDDSASRDGAAASGGSASGSGVSATVGGGSGSVTVHVTGAVRRPGVYELQEGARVFEAVRKAGGAKRGADRQRLNLAAPVRDGQQVLVPARTPPAAAGTAGGPPSPGDTPVDLNTATLEQLQTLDGVGPTTAEKILKLREERGGLGGVDDLDEVPGIGPKTIEALRGQLGG